MRVLFDATTAHIGGGRTYLLQFLKHLPELIEDDHYTVLVPAAAEAEFLPLVQTPQLTLIPFSTPVPGLARHFYARGWQIPQLLRRHRADVLFSSTGFGVPVRPCPELLLIRNAIYYCPFYQKLPLPPKDLLQTKLRRWMSDLSIRRTDCVLFPSQAMLDEVATALPLAQKRTAVLHYGVAHEHFSAKDAQPFPLEPSIKRWREAGELILLHVSTYAIHKNLETLIEAIPAVLQAGIKCKLVTTVDLNKTIHPQALAQLLKRIKQLGIEEHFASVGHLSYDQIARLYGLADVFVFPSLTESFGHPLVEAMASSLPVVASNRPIHRELGGDAFAYFEAQDVADCARVLCEVLRDPPRRITMGQRAKERAAAFSWKTHIQGVIALLRELTSTHRA